MYAETLGHYGNEHNAVYASNVVYRQVSPHN